MAGSYPACDLTSAVLKSRAIKNRFKEVLGELSEDKDNKPVLKSAQEAELFEVVARKIRGHYQIET